MIAGVATSHFGLQQTALAYRVAIAALVAVAAGSLMLRSRGPFQRARPGRPAAHDWPLALCVGGYERVGNSV